MPLSNSIAAQGSLSSPTRSSPSQSPMAPVESERSVERVVKKVVTTTTTGTSNVVMEDTRSTSPPTSLRSASPISTPGGTGTQFASVATWNSYQGRASTSPPLPSSTFSLSASGSPPLTSRTRTSSAHIISTFEPVDDTPFWRDHSRVNERVRELREALDRFKGACSTPATVNVQPSLLSRTTFETREVDIESVSVTNATLQSKVESLNSDLRITQAELEREKRESKALREALQDAQRNVEKQTNLAARSQEYQSQLTKLQQSRQSSITNESELKEKVAALERQIITSKERERNCDALKLELSQCCSRTEEQHQQILLLRRDNEELRSQVSLLQLNARATPSPIPATTSRAVTPLPNPSASTVTTLNVGQQFQLAAGCGHVRMGLGWDTKIDLDASVLMLDVDGKYHDHVYFGKQTSQEGAIKHWGDNLTGEGDGDDEVIDVDLARVSSGAVFLFFIVNVYTDGPDFSDVKGASCRLLDMTSTARAASKGGIQGAPLARFNISAFGQNNRGLVFVCLFRDPERMGAWRLMAIGEGVSGKCYRDVEPDCTRIAKTMQQSWEVTMREWVLTEYNKQQQNSRPSAPISLTSWGKPFSIPHFMTRLRMGLGWETKTDLDASVVILDLEGKYHDHVYFGRKTSKDGAIRHAGDNLTGEGEGDDEAIDVDLDKLSKQSAFLFFTVTVYSDDQDFSGVEGAFCRLLDLSNAVATAEGSPKGAVQLSRFELSQSAGHNTAQVFVCLYRDPERIGGWKMLALGEPSEGRAARDLEPKCTQLAARLRAQEEQTSYQGVWRATTSWVSGERLPRRRAAGASRGSFGKSSTTTTTRVVTSHLEETIEV